MAFRLDIGTLYAPNITPASLGTWTDGEVLRAMTEGVSKDGSPLFPLMPYDNLRQMAREDAEAVIAFIRTLPGVHRDNPRTTLRFPMNLIVRTLPQPALLPVSRPDPSDRVAYGRYVTTIASCASCHTRMERGQPVPGMTFAGGLEFNHAFRRRPAFGEHHTRYRDRDRRVGRGPFRRTLQEHRGIGRIGASPERPAEYRNALARLWKDDS